LCKVITGDLAPGDFLPISKNDTEAEMTPVWYHWRYPGRIAESACHSDRKGLPGSVPKMEADSGNSVYTTCGRELLRGKWHPIGLTVRFMILTSSVRNILDCRYRHTSQHNWYSADYCTQ
jgi:hypothetical protein